MRVRIISGGWELSGKGFKGDFVVSLIEREWD